MAVASGGAPWVGAGLIGQVEEPSVTPTDDPSGGFSLFDLSAGASVLLLVFALVAVAAAVVLVWLLVTGRSAAEVPGEAGWRPDPTGRHELRWYDGGWSEHVLDGGTRQLDPPP